MFEGGFHLSFYALCVVLLWFAARGLLGGTKVFAYPTLAAMMGLAWVVPQGIELEQNPANLYGSETFWLYVTACFLFIAFGFRAGYSAQRRRTAGERDRSVPSFNNNRLIIAAAGLTALGLLSVFQILTSDTSLMGAQWTGVITLWALLAKASGFGLCLAVLVFARTGSRLALVIAAVAAIPVAQSAFLSIRRESLFDLAILSVGAWYLARRSYPPRVFVVAGLLIGTVVLNTAGDIRERLLVGEESFAAVLSSQETYQNFDYTSIGQKKASEVGLAQFDAWYVNQTGSWEVGAEHWNSLMSQYFPAFLFGRELKESLTLSTLASRISKREEKGASSLGSTRTGFSDSYRAFGFFGVFIFYLISYLFGVLFARLNTGRIEAQYLYLVLLAEGLKVVTHSTSEFFAALPFVLILYWLTFRFARIQKHPASKARIFKPSLELSDLAPRP